jgi:hypothetical protein
MSFWSYPTRPADGKLIIMHVRSIQYSQTMPFTTKNRHRGRATYSCFFECVWVCRTRYNPLVVVIIINIIINDLFDASIMVVVLLQWN